MKVLGAFCLIDQGELDWKVLTLNVSEAREGGIRNMQEYMRVNPGAVEEVQQWLKMYKTFEGKSEN